MQEVTSIGSITISAGWDKGRPILVLNNNGQRGEFIDCRYLELGKSSSKTWKILYVPYGKQKQEQLPDNFRKWGKFGFHINGKRLLAPVSELEKVLQAVKKQIIIEPSQPETATAITKPEQPEEAYALVDKVIKPNIETTHVPELSSNDYKQEAKTIVQQTNERVSELARAYKDGGSIDFVNIENPTPSQNVLLILNWIVGTITEWQSKLEQSRKIDQDLIDILTYREQDIKEKLKAIRGDKTPGPATLDVETDISTDAELNEIKKECSYHVAWFEGRLFGYEERVEIDNLEEYDQFIPQFIRDRLFNSVSRFVSFDQLPETIRTMLTTCGL